MKEVCFIISFAPQFSFHVFDHPMSRGFQNRFSTQYRCYSVSMLAGPNDRSDVEKGGKSKHDYLFLRTSCKQQNSLIPRIVLSLLYWILLFG